jgi:hypothetical protein
MPSDVWSHVRLHTLGLDTLGAYVPTFTPTPTLPVQEVSVYSDNLLAILCTPFAALTYTPATLAMSLKTVTHEIYIYTSSATLLSP